MKRVIYLQEQKTDSLVDHIIFPTGEEHIRIRELSSSDSVVLVYNDPRGDLMKLGMAVNICNQAGVSDITLVMQFVPYARQDQVYVEGDALSIKVFANFINSLILSKVIITDPHSLVTSALIDNVQVVPQCKIAAYAVLELDDFNAESIVIVAPDLGASKKVKELQSFLLAEHNISLEIAQCDKVRDPETGDITGFKLLDGDVDGCHCLMVDDICDGGGTFLGLYPVLKDAGAVAQSLYVTHGIFSKGTKNLLEMFDTIYMSNSFPPQTGVTTIYQELT